MLQQEISTFLTYLKSASTSQKYLKNCYKKNEFSGADKLSYQNSYRFLYYLDHGQIFYKMANQSDMVVKPILYFYGMVHLLKACLLTRRPNYPENTSLLAHGVSTRKRKKQQYAFLQDEVKVQHKGLYPYFSSHLFEIDELPNEKVDMNQLLATIPELNDLFIHHRREGTLIKIGTSSEKQLHLPHSLLDSYHMTENNLLSHISKHLTHIIGNSKDDIHTSIHLAEPLPPSSKGPFYYHLKEQAFYLPKNRHYFSTNHEIMNHYLLLYNLSMICRYETEWWGELTQTLPTEDYPFISQFLNITATKVPFLLGYFLLQETKD